MQKPAIAAPQFDPLLDPVGPRASMGTETRTFKFSDFDLSVISI
jgi:hypothetical protein